MAAALVNTVLHVSGLSCGSCVSRAEAALRAVPGVSQANVNLADKRAQISFDARATNAGALVSAVTDAGYPAAIAQPDHVMTEDGSEAEQLRNDLRIAAVLTLPVFIIEMGGHLFPPIHHAVHGLIGMQTAWVLQFFLVTAVLVWPGRVFFAKGFAALARFAPDMNALVAIGAGAAWVFSTIATFAPALLPAGTRAVYFEAAAVIVTLILLGRWLEARAKGQTGAAIAKLIQLRPQTATVLRNGKPETARIDDIAVGDLVQLHPGERVALDGIVTEGQSFIDESMISGEPAPVARQAGDLVIGGTVNGAGALIFRVTHTGETTVLSQIIAMVRQAQAARLPVQDLVNRITHWFVPAVLGLGVITVLAWLVFGPGIGFALVAGISVLIVACPCAMGLAVPMSIMVGTGRAAELGVLFRKGDALQGLQQAKVVAFDKTGTLTMGKPAVTEMITVGDLTEAEVLAAAASLEQQSEHPLGRAILAAADARSLDVRKVDGFATVTGQGIRGTVGGAEVMIGNARMLKSAAIPVADLNGDAERAAAAGQTPVYVAIGGQLAGLICVADPIKPEATVAIQQLRAQGMQVAMITGDVAGTAQAVADQLGIDHVISDVLPEGKLRAVTELQSRFGPTAFVGDGINDAPALAAADIGIALGTGADVAVESADVVLMSGKMSAVASAFAVSRQTMRNIKQNLFWAFAYNIALIPVAAGALYLFAGPLLSPMLAAGAMAASSVFVVSNALRLRRVGQA